MSLKWKNNAAGTLGANVAAIDTTIQLTAGHGSRFPTTSAEDYFFVTLRANSGTLEIVKVTDRSTDVLTVVRAQDGFSAGTFLTGEFVEMRWCNIMIQAEQDEATQAAATSGTDTYTASLRVTPKAYNTGQIYFAKIGNANATSAPTINFSSLGAKTIKRQGSLAVAVGDLPAGWCAQLLYNGTDMILLNPATGNIPPATMLDFAGGTLEAGYLLCDGSLANRTTDAALFSKIGTTYGVGDGSTTFGLPDSRRRVTVGKGGTGSATLAATVGATGGEEAHALSAAEGPSHAHTPGNGGGFWDTTGTAGTTFAAAAGSQPIGVSGVTSSSGSGTAHNNMPPSLVVTKMIKR